jgi:hypothetical protein
MGLFMDIGPSRGVSHFSSHDAGSGQDHFTTAAVPDPGLGAAITSALDPGNRKHQNVGFATVASSRRRCRRAATAKRLQHGKKRAHRGRALHRGNGPVAELLPPLNEKSPGKSGTLAL